MLLEDVVSLGEDRVPLMVRMLRRALTKHSNILIDLNVKSGRKRGFLTGVEEGGGWSTGDVGTKIPTYRFTYHRQSNSGVGTFELPAASIDSTMTFTKEDGELKVVNVVDKMNEMEVAGQPPLWFNLLKKGLAAGKNFYFASGGNRIYNAIYTPTLIRLAMKNRKTKAENAYTMVPDNFENWKLEKFEDGHRLIMRKTVKEDADDIPTVVKIMNNRLEKMGAIKANLNLSMGGKPVTGWITKPLVPVDINGAKYKASITVGGKAHYTYYFPGNADELYTLRTDKDGNGNKYVEVMNREAK